MASIFISLLYLESHAVFISEASATSEAIGAAARFAVLNITVMAGLITALVFRRARPPKALARPTQFEVKVASVIILGVMTAEIANLTLSRSTAFPWGQAVRHNYWSEFAFAPALEAIFGTFAIFVPFMASALFVYGVENKWPTVKWMAVGVIGTYFVYLFGMGQVFHGHLVPATIISGTYIIWKVVKRKNVLSGRVSAYLIVFGVTVSIAAVSSISQRDIGRGRGGEATLYRLLVIQGGVIWKADEMRQRGFEGSVNDLLEGRIFLLRTILPPELAKSYERSGVNLQGALPSTAYLALGMPMAMVVCFLYGLLCGAAMRLMTWLFVTGQLLLMFFASYLWLWLMTAYGRASLETILSPSFALVAILVAGWIVMRPFKLGRLKRKVSSLPKRFGF
jgi:hypothetical protein